MSKIEEKYPEHMKLKAVKDKTQAIHDFLEFVGEEENGGYYLCYETEPEEEDPILYPIDKRAFDQALAKWAGIDLKRLEEEKHD